MNPRVFFIAGGLFLSLIFSIPYAPATEKEKIPKFCAHTLTPAIRDLVDHEFPKPPGQLITIGAQVDLEFDSAASECMATVALVLKPSNQYAIFHIHYGENGKWIPKGVKGKSGYYTPDWKYNTDESAWHKDFCGFVLSWAPSQLTDYNCEIPPNSNRHHH